MGFISFEYLVFLSWALFSYHLITNKIKNKHLYVIALSLSFYAYSSDSYLLLIIIIPFLDWNWANLIRNSARPFWRKVCLVCSLLIDLGLLFWFKYAEKWAEILFQPAGFHWSFVFPEGLPLGISFFTFQSLSYVLDAYFRQGYSGARIRFSDYLFYISFFPQLVAGPIVAAREFLPQLLINKKLKKRHIKLGMSQIMSGYVKKFLLADSVAIVSDEIFNHYSDYNSASVFLGVVAYCLQIYLDFAGYSDIAIGSARLFGFKIPLNFKAPYSAVSLREFWRRWHISLSKWLRTYLYIGALGGNRVSSMRGYWNLLLTMLLGGIWHGANLTFWIWGFGHGLFLILERFLGEQWVKIGFMREFRFRWLGLFWVWLSVGFLWIFFRAETVSEALGIFSSFWNWRSDGLELWYSWKMHLLYVLVFVFLGHWVWRWEEKSHRIALWVARSNDWVFGCFFAVSALVVVAMGTESRQFIYFVF